MSRSNTLTEGQDDEICKALDAIIVGVHMQLVHLTALWKFQRWLGVGAHGHMIQQIKNIDNVSYGIVSSTQERGQDAPRKVNNIVSMFVDLYAQGSFVSSAQDRSSVST